MTYAETLMVAETMAAISRGRQRRPFWRKALTVQQALAFLQNPHDYIDPVGAPRQQWVAEAIAIAKMVCELCGFLDENICPLVRKL